LAIAEIIRRYFPDVIVAARAVDRSHAHDLMALGVHVFERETFRAAVKLGERALAALGHPADEGRHVAAAFEAHDTRMLHDRFGMRHDQQAYIGFVRRSTALLEEVMRADVESTGQLERRTTTDENPASSPLDTAAESPPEVDKQPSTPSDLR